MSGLTEILSQEWTDPFKKFMGRCFMLLIGCEVMKFSIAAFMFGKECENRTRNLRVVNSHFLRSEEIFNKRCIDQDENHTNLH